MPRKTTTTETTTETPAAEPVAPNANLELWDSVQQTDPKYTKSFSRSGGFKGTAINHTYQQRRATETFGPKGIGWGSIILDEKYVEGAPLIHKEQVLAHREIVHVVRIELWYALKDTRRGAVQAFGQTTFVGSNKHGFFTDEEAPKKSLTDAESKALASLGFSADVHLGLFDDNKYVSDLKAKSDEAEKAAKQEAYSAMRAEIFGAVESAATLDALKASTAKAAALTDEDRAQLKTVYLARKADIEAAK
jgi:hypothetical protein